MSRTEIVRVDLDARGYDVQVGEGLLARAGDAIAPFASQRRVFVVADQSVARLHRPALEQGLAAAGLESAWIVITPGEEQKSFAGLERVCAQLLSAGLDRRSLILAFGGGVIGDLAGFAAGVIMRGVDFVQIPTTLLAQVDSSVGGKTAIDTAQGKNLVGLFHQPRLVLADLDVLRTLDPRELRAGYAEVVKYGLIDDAGFFAWCEQNGALLLAGDAELLKYAIAHCVRAKARIVAADEREAGARALLNLGHTFAHAFEVMAGFSGVLLHGEAVAIGLRMAFSFSAREGLCAPAHAARVRAHLEASGFTVVPKRLAGGPFDADALARVMVGDKKNEAGALTLILARAIGEAFVQRGASWQAVRAFLAEELAP